MNKNKQDRSQYLKNGKTFSRITQRIVFHTSSMAEINKFDTDGGNVSKDGNSSVEIRPKLNSEKNN